MKPAEYAKEIERLSKAIDRIPDICAREKPEDINEIMLHYIDMNLAHILGICSHKSRMDMARIVLRNILLTRNIDHVPEHCAFFYDHLETIDPSNIMDSGDPVIFSGFHTGPYWSLMLELIKRGKDFSAVFPRHLKTLEFAILKSFMAAKKKLKSRSTLEFLRTDSPNFFLTAKYGLRAGRAMIVYVDAKSGVSTDMKRYVDIDFMRRKISVKTSIFKLARISNAKVVSFATRRKSGMERTLILGRPLCIAKGENSLLDAVNGVYSDLENALSIDPTQWEGWLYFHKFLKRIQNNADDINTIEWGARYFIEEDGQKVHLIDKSSLTTYAIRSAPCKSQVNTSNGF